MKHLMILCLAVAACGGDDGRPCEVTEAQPSVPTVDCREEFDLQATRPLDSSLPGAVTVKTIIDQANADAVHILDTASYPIHSAFAIEHLMWPPGQPFTTEYLYPQRRFLLGSITYFEEPDLWTYELAPYDTASVDMITKAMELLSEATFFGDELAFHPVSIEQIDRAEDLPEHIRVVTTDDIYAGISYQPLNLGETVAQVRVLTVDELEAGYVSPREIAVLDRVPNDISVVAGVVTDEFQTPLSHVNVLSQQRGTPNMGLRGARGVFEAYEGRWVRLSVTAFDYTVEEASQAEADAWWEANRPEPVDIVQPDLSVQTFVDVDAVTLADIPAVGGKAANFGELRDIDGLVVPDGFAVPVYFYTEFLEENGFDVEIAAMLADEQFISDGVYRRQRLAQLRDDIRATPLAPLFVQGLESYIASEFPVGTTMRFRSSTNAEDLDGFSGAGLYTSASGAVGDPEQPVADAVREVWASLWNARAYEERDYVSIDHSRVGMALLVHPAFVAETANGVAITANIFDAAPGGEDAFYINAQFGEVSVVQPPTSNTVADQLMYYYLYNNQPATYYTHSSLVADGETVLTRRELFDLGTALMAIRGHFSDLYDPPDGYAILPMDVEWKRTGTGDDSVIEVKQARPYPGRGQ